MKRKNRMGVYSVICAAALTLPLAACVGPMGPADDPDADPPNYTPPEQTASQLLKYELNEDETGYVVTGLVDGATNATINIPDTYRDLPVTEIGERAFGSCRDVTSVRIGANVTTIGSGAFTDCVGLPSFRFPDSIAVIGDSAFQNCTGLRAVYFNATSELESIESNAFQGCTALITANIPDSVVTIGDRVFQGCGALRSVTIGDGVESVGEEAFRGCEKLATVTIGGSLKTIAERAFLDCTQITEIHFPDTLESVGLGALSGCTGIKNITLPFIGSEKYDTAVPESDEDSPDNHTNFGYIFGASSLRDHYKLELNNLETLTITGNSPIGYHAFQDIGRWTNADATRAQGLSTIIITGNVKIIGTGAFASCRNLHTLVLPKSVASIGGQVLSDTLIETVYYCGTESEWNRISDGGYANNMHLYGKNALGEAFMPDPRHFYTETEPASGGNFWHYVDGKPTKW